MNATTTPYRLAPKPRLVQFYEWDCQVCGHETLKRPVFLTGPEGTTFAAGSGCAAELLYGHRDRTAQARVRREWDAVQHAADVAADLAAERRVRYTLAAEQFAADQAGAPALESARQAYWATVRHDWNGEHRLTFPAFIAQVAATGDLDVVVPAPV